MRDLAPNDNAMQTRAEFTAGLPQLDIYTLSEDWALATALESHWRILADCLGLPPSKWLDRSGARMYGAVIYLATQFDLDDPLKEDDAFTAETRFRAIRKPHALSTTRFMVNGKAIASVDMLTCFIKRQQSGSNKKFSKTRDIWTSDEFNDQAIEELLDQHHGLKDHCDKGEVTMTYEVNRIQDFNTADFLYFKNFVGIAKAAEWRHRRGGPVHLNATREAFFYGNVEDGQIISTKVSTDEGVTQTSHHSDDGRRIFLSLANCLPVQVAER